jgi:hypothetical protein
LISTSHTASLARAIAVVGMVISVGGVMLLAVQAVILITESGFRMFSFSLMLYAAILLLTGWLLMRKAGKYAIIVYGWSQDWISDTDSVEDRSESVAVVKLLFADAVALTVIGLLFTVNGVFSLADLVYDALFGTDMNALFGTDVFSSPYNFLSKQLYLGVIELVLGLILLLGQRKVLGWLRRIHEPHMLVEPDDQMPSEV